MNLYSLSAYKVNILIKHKLITKVTYKSFRVLNLRYNTSKFKHPVAFLIVAIIINLISTSPYPNVSVLAQHQAFSELSCLSQMPSLLKRIIQL